MAQSINSILEQRRTKNERDLENRIDRIYKKSPRIKEIDKEIRRINFDRMDYILRSRDTEELTNRVSMLRQEKQELLSSLGIDESYFEMKYYCDICKDTGDINGQICQCKKQLMIEALHDQSSIKERIKKENFSRFALSKFSKVRQPNKDLSPYDNMKILRKNIDIYLNSFGKGSPSLYLYGSVGTGKTFMVNCIAKELMDKNYSVLYQSADDLLQTLADYKFMYYEEKKNHQAKIEYIFDVDVLIIDDLGTENTNELTRSNLFEVINKRIVSSKPTIISSNLNSDDLKQRYDSRIYSRIIGEYNMLHFYGNDLRMA